MTSNQDSIWVGVYWRRAVWDLSRSAYIADLDTDTDCPDAFVGWLARAITAYTELSPEERATDAATELPASPRKGFNKAHPLPMVTLDALTEAVLADRSTGRKVSRSAFIQRAVIAAASESRARLGHAFPPPPANLANRPPRRPQAQRRPLTPT